MSTATMTEDIESLLAGDWDEAATAVESEVVEYDVRNESGGGGSWYC
ncbi:hypothetical protein POF50_008520 [Streptomyces sp. SL13]|jgi:hypothetical protein|uniref:Uncharacterized protein n=1 Tax=Streptantibioticus silvisoli TaxID=2705255 RepID=A0AA90KFV9_9ACTN|nr:hypothetical protein [Streptantibioticus silvisoli]MDI5969389.1 hypothetical protein [Streptantibioticus silvisoli]